MRVALTDVRRRRAAARSLLLLHASLLALAAAGTWAARHPSYAQSPATRPPASSSVPKPPQGAPRAAKLAEYRDRVRESFGLLEELASEYELVRRSEDYEVWSREDFNSDFVVELPRRAQATYAKVRGLLPPREQVEWGGRAVEVDNAWAHEAVEGLSREGDSEKAASSLRALAGRLRALEARLAELDGGAPAGVDRDAERGRLNSILRRPEFDRQAPKEPGALGRMVEDFLEWLSGLLPKRTRVTPGASPRASMTTLILVGVLCLAVMAYVGWLLWLRRGAGSVAPRRGARVVLGERLEEDQTASDLLDEAERLARSGELRGAIRKAYVALLCELGDRGVVRLAQHKTNRDYLDAVRRAARPRLYTEMLPLTSDFELHWYGLRPASDADWESFRTRCRKAVKEVVSSQ